MPRAGADESPTYGDNPPVREGDVVAGRFRIGRRLGAGGMGVVVEATRLDVRERVALKFLRSRADRPAIERLLREARATARLTNPHVTRVLDVGRLDSGMPFIVMEYLEGETLSALLDRSPRLPIEEVAEYALQACEALADAHAHGIVHRDIKPGNLFLIRVPSGRTLLKVLDFGIAKFISTQDAGLTTTGTIMGSPSFASPEQLLHPKTVDARTDVWGLGVTLYQMFAKELPFNGDNAIQLSMLVLNSTPVPLHELRPDLPPRLADAVMRCLQKDASKRFPSVAEFAREIEPFAPELTHGTADRIATMFASATPVAEDRESVDMHVQVRAPAEPMRARWKRAIVLGALLATVASVIVVASLGRRPHGPVAAVLAPPAPPVLTDAPSPALTPKVETVDPPAPTVTAESASASVAPLAPFHVVKPLAPAAKRDPRSYR